MKYILVEWPEIQEYMDREEVYFDPNKNVWFIPEDWIEEEWSGGEIVDLDEAMG